MQHLRFWKCSKSVFKQTFHLFKVVHEEIKPFKCDNCGFEAALKLNLDYHMLPVHEGTMCNVCDYEYDLKKISKRTIQSVHEGIKPFLCNIWGKMKKTFWIPLLKVGL